MKKPQPRRVDKLLFSSWSNPPTLFAYRHHSLSSVRRVVSCRALFGFLSPYTLGSVDPRPPTLFIITRRIIPFSLHNPSLSFLFLILSSSPFLSLIMTSLSVSISSASSVHSASPLSFHTASSPPSPSPLTASSASSSQISFNQADEG